MVEVCGAKYDCGEKFFWVGQRDSTSGINRKDRIYSHKEYATNETWIGALKAWMADDAMSRCCGWRDADYLLLCETCLKKNGYLW